MTQAQFEALKPGDLIRNWREPGAGGPVFTVARKTSAGYAIQYPLPIKRTARACTASAWELVTL
jgi:hypothetical protein